jgi:hypothetical protein
MTEVQTNPMRYEILVPSAMYDSESVLDLDRAYDLMYDLAEEHGYAEIRRDGMVIADRFSDTINAIADCVFG